MPKATPGAQYTIVQGDTLSDIAAQAYGNGSKWPLIWRANQSVLRSGDPDLIFPGEVITIPVDPELAALENQLSGELVGKEPDDFTFEIGGKEIPIESGSLIRTMDTAADGFAVSMQWDPEDLEIYELIRPYNYQAVKCYLGAFLMFTGVLYTVEPKSGTGGVLVTLTGASAVVDMVDSTVRPPYESKKITLKDRADELIGPLGIPVVYDFENDETFDRVTAEPTDTIFAHLAGLATQRAVLISSTREGEAIFYQANTTGAPVATLEEGKPPVRDSAAKFDGRQRFNVYKAIANSPNRKRKTAVAKDTGVPKSRFKTFRAEDTTAGNIQAAADWRRSKQVADALTIDIPVDSWYTPAGELWAENTLVTYKAPALFIPDGFDFLIRRAEFSYSNEGTTAVLSVVPPQVYSGEAIGEPWFQ